MPIKEVIKIPRPTKLRKVCCLPESNLFGPITPHLDKREMVLMTVDEYETVRLIDLEDMNQEECAERMGVARTTAQKIYGESKKKIADAIVNGKILKIEGGDYKLCEGEEKVYGCKRCKRGRGCK
ncbi:putative DNA-binding protein (UPF0251 family) [Acetoanaerobium pronyense]|uniref:UPF0251 protein J2Z35_000555 n=1 Tax=Acetoanaerobium pronyense TaxID=1482736 RepID=A0ABS4KJF0_9FIRM|nr:DUF134 domain-containing protein [Acetoanaerobium pronyense]MBP2026764.1 putative DNA-binding protein (UPF0251 family) [Acetoanaerobium pronyense]